MTSFGSGFGELDDRQRALVSSACLRWRHRRVRCLAQRVRGGKLPNEQEAAGSGSAAADAPLSARLRSPQQSRTPTYGTGLFVTQPDAPTEPASQPMPEQGGSSFQFQDAPIEAVLSQVLGEAFGVSYFLEPGLQARLTLRLDGIADGDAAAAALGAALQLQGINVAKTPSGYSVSRIQPGASGRFQILASPTDAPVGDAAVLVLHHADADDVVRLARPLIPAEVIKLHDRATGIVLLQGNPQALAAAVDALRTFDVDWFQSVSSAFVELEYASPTELKQELDQILGRTGGWKLSRCSGLALSISLPGHATFWTVLRRS